MIRQYEIRQRSIEVSTQRPSEVSVDGLLLPWRRGDQEREATGILQKAGGDILSEIAEYKGERDVMLTSAGALPVRFLFHLTLPEEGKVDLETLEERFRDCLFQAGVLSLKDLAIPIIEFAPFVDSFSDLVDMIWNACREFLTHERGPRRILFLVEDRDLRGQYLRHFFSRKQADEQHWQKDEIENPDPPPIQGAPSIPSLPQHENRERVLSLNMAEADALEASLLALLTDYREGRNLDSFLQKLSPSMQQALEHSFKKDEEQSTLPEKLRILGSNIVLKLPWELLPVPGGFLAEEHLLTRGTNFLHFRKGRSRIAKRDFQLSFRVMGNATAARRLAEELKDLSEQRKPGLNWSTGEMADARLVHCLGRSAAEALLAEMPLPCELVYIELEPGENGSDQKDAGLEEWVRQLLAHGCRRVLAPLVAFRSEEERLPFRTAFYDRLLSGASVGEALHYAQRVTMEAFGVHSGWWLYRIFGQTDEALIPAGKATRREDRVRGLA